MYEVGSTVIITHSDLKGQRGEIIVYDRSKVRQYKVKLESGRTIWCQISDMEQDFSASRTADAGQN